MAIIAELPGRPKRFIASETSDTITVPIAGGNQAVTVTMKDLRRVEKVIQVNVTTDPVADVSLPQNIVIDKNVVGMTLRFGAGTTLVAEVIATGF